MYSYMYVLSSRSRCDLMRRKFGQCTFTTFIWPSYSKEVRDFDLLTKRECKTRNPRSPFLRTLHVGLHWHDGIGRIV